MRGSGGGTERVKLSRLKVVCIGGVLASSDQLESLFSAAHRLSLRIIPLDFTFASIPLRYSGIEYAVSAYMYISHTLVVPDNVSCNVKEQQEIVR